MFDSSGKKYHLLLISRYYLFFITQRGVLQVKKIVFPIDNIFIVMQNSKSIKEYSVKEYSSNSYSLAT